MYAPASLWVFFYVKEEVDQNWRNTTTLPAEIFKVIVHGLLQCAQLAKHKDIFNFSCEVSYTLDQIFYLNLKTKVK